MGLDCLGYSLDGRSLAHAGRLGLMAKLPCPGDTLTCCLGKVKLLVVVALSTHIC